MYAFGEADNSLAWRSRTNTALVHAMGNSSFGKFSLPQWYLSDYGREHAVVDDDFENRSLADTGSAGDASRARQSKVDRMHDIESVDLRIGAMSKKLPAGPITHKLLRKQHINAVQLCRRIRETIKMMMYMNHPAVKDKAKLQRLMTVFQNQFLCTGAAHDQPSGSMFASSSGSTIGSTRDPPKYLRFALEQIRDCMVLVEQALHVADVFVSKTERDAYAASNVLNRTNQGWTIPLPSRMNWSKEFRIADIQNKENADFGEQEYCDESAAYFQ